MITIKNLQDFREEMKHRGSSLLEDKFYPATSNWIPLPDAMASLDLHEKRLRDLAEKLRSIGRDDTLGQAAGLVAETIDFILTGETAEHSVLRQLLGRFEA